MSARVAELESQIRRLVRQRDAQPADTFFAYTHQQKIDALSVELIAWQLEPARMLAAEEAIRSAARRQRRAQTGSSRWPIVSGVSGVLGGVATAGHLAADAGGLPVIGGALLTAAAAALALTVADRSRDAREVAQAEVDMETAQQHYAAVVQRHARAIAPLRPLAIHQEETPCPSSPRPATPSTTTTGPAPRSGPAAAATAGHLRVVSRPSASPSSTAVA